MRACLQFGNTPLHNAAREDNAEFAKLLLEEGDSGLLDIKDCVSFDSCVLVCQEVGRGVALL